MSEATQTKLSVQFAKGWRRSHFVRHLVEMFLAMQIGMAVGSLLFALTLGPSAGNTSAQHAVAFLLSMAFSMTAPMVAWMVHRGHSWRSAGEMATVMITPALPLLGLKIGHVISGSGGCAYMSASTIAMILLIVHRRSEYRMTAEAHA